MSGGGYVSGKKFSFDVCTEEEISIFNDQLSDWKNSLPDIEQPHQNQLHNSV